MRKNRKEFSFSQEEQIKNSPVQRKMRTKSQIRTTGAKKLKFRSKFFTVALCSSFALTILGFSMVFLESPEINEERNYHGE